jgi:hypothetical protein
MTTTTISEQIQALHEDLKESQSLLAKAQAVQIPPSLADGTETPASPRSPWAPLAAALALGILIGFAAAATLI